MSNLRGLATMVSGCNKAGIVKLISGGAWALFWKTPSLLSVYRAKGPEAWPTKDSVRGVRRKGGGHIDSH